MEPQNTSRSISSLVRERIASEGERLWRVEDFQGQSFAAVTQALSRLAKEGMIERLSKGIYYHPRETVFGKSLPHPSALYALTANDYTLFPAGVAAANVLGFTTQMPRHRELATTSQSLPRKHLEGDTIIHTRRPEAWSKLSQEEAALLDFLRQGGHSSDLSREETVERTLSLLSKAECYEHLVQVADSEPPRIRALLGALGEQLGKPQETLHRLKASLNPLSRFGFGVFSVLPNARLWQAKEKHRKS